MWPLSRAEMVSGAIRRPLFFAGARKSVPPSGVGQERREFAFQPRPVEHSEFYRDIVKPARSKGAIEMPQSGNDHPDDGNLDVGPRLIEDEEVEPGASNDIDTGLD